MRLLSRLRPCTHNDLACQAADLSRPGMVRLRRTRHITGLCAVALLCGAQAQAALFDRGSGLVYDSVFNITWLADLNHAHTSGHAATGVAPGTIGATAETVWTDGRMGWAAASMWADTLVYAGYSDWRLPELNNADPTCSVQRSVSPTILEHYGIGCTGGELSHLFVADLGNVGYESVLNITTEDSTQQVANLALFSHVQEWGYWSATTRVADASGAWMFSAQDGYRDYNLKSTPLFAVAVRAGDVALAPVTAVPEPHSLALVLLALCLTRAARPLPAARWSRKDLAAPARRREGRAERGHGLTSLPSTGPLP